MSEQNPIPVVPDVGMPIEEGVKALVALTPRKEAAADLRRWQEKYAAAMRDNKMLEDVWFGLDLFIRALEAGE